MSVSSIDSSVFYVYVHLVSSTGEEELLTCKVLGNLP